MLVIKKAIVVGLKKGVLTDPAITGAVVISEDNERASGEIEKEASAPQTGCVDVGGPESSSGAAAAG